MAQTSPSNNTRTMVGPLLPLLLAATAATAQVPPVSRVPCPVSRHVLQQARCSQFRSEYCNLRLDKIMMLDTGLGSPQECQVQWGTRNNGKEVPRWGVAKIQKMSPSTTGRCYCCH